MFHRFSRLSAAVIAAALLCSCAQKEGAPLSSGDSAATLPVTEPTVVSVTVTTQTEPPVTTAATESAPPETGAAETTAALGYTIDALSAKMYATDILNVREFPTTEAKVVGQLNVGDEADVVGLTSHGWYQIRYDGGAFFVKAEYLSSEKPAETEEELTIPENYYFASSDDYFFVVNKDNPLPEDYSIETSFVQGSYEMEIVAAYNCRRMIDAAAKDGIDLKVLSAYRTIKYQENLFDRNVKSRMEDDGMSYEEAYADTAVNIAPPGGSEHNAGLAVDIIDRNHWDTYTDFENTPEFAWLSENCTKYGFILRYPKGKEDITGYIYEPWHYRYVGAEYASAVMNSGLCLEEYIG